MPPQKKPAQLISDKLRKAKKIAQTKRKVCPRSVRWQSTLDEEGATAVDPAPDRDGEYDARDDLGDVGCWVANVTKQTCRTAVSRSWC